MSMSNWAQNSSKQIEFAVLCVMIQPGFSQSMFEFSRNYSCTKLVISVQCICCANFIYSFRMCAIYICANLSLPASMPRTQATWKSNSRHHLGASLTELDKSLVKSARTRNLIWGTVSACKRRPLTSRRQPFININMTRVRLPKDPGILFKKTGEQIRFPPCSYLCKQGAHCLFCR